MGLLKSTYYRVFNPDLKPFSLRLGYVFHTEAVYDRRLFQKLLDFCQQYLDLTGKKPICVVIPACNPIVRSGLEKSGTSEEHFVQRLENLQRCASIGYHGHFFVDCEAYDIPQSRMLQATYNKNSLAKQFRRDLEWFKEAGLKTPKLYSGGWWFMHPQLLELLMGAGFTIDFSFSPYPRFFSQFSKHLLTKHEIFPGQLFQIETGKNNQLLCVQNLIGCHETRFPQDLVRFLKPHLDRRFPQVTGVVHSHDYSLAEYERETVACLRYLRQFESVSFCGAEDFMSMPVEKNVPLNGD